MKCITLIILVISVSFFGCRNNKESSSTYYYKATNEGKIVSYQKIDYNYVLDSIIESVTIYNLKGEVIQKQKNHFIKSEKGLDIIINGKREQYLQLTKKDSCVIYKHPIGYDIKNCFLKILDYKGNKNALKFNYTEEVIDGLSMTIFLNNDYSLIDKKEIIGSGSFDELVKIDKSSVPKK